MLENLADQGGLGARLIAARSARSQRIETAPAARSGAAPELVRSNAAAGLHVAAETCDSKWDGGAVDYDLVLTALFQNGSQHMRHPNT